MKIKDAKILTSRREHYQSELECPSCKKVCMATWEENENPVHARSGFCRKLISLSAGFRKAPKSNTVICEACGLAISSWA